MQGNAVGDDLRDEKDDASHDQEETVESRAAPEQRSPKITINISFHFTESCFFLFLLVYFQITDFVKKMFV